MLEKLNEKAKRLTYVDIKLIQLAVIVIAIILVKLFPKLSNIDYWVLIVLLIVFAAKPFYKFWIKNNEIMMSPSVWWFILLNEGVILHVTSKRCWIFMVHQIDQTFIVGF